MDTEIITAVWRHPELYDTSSPLYKDVERRKNVWTMIGKGLDMTGDECKTRWKTLRDGFTRALRLQRRRGQTAFIRKPWRYQREMEFLIPFLVQKEDILHDYVSSTKPSVQILNVGDEHLENSVEICNVKTKIQTDSEDEFDNPNIQSVSPTFVTQASIASPSPQNGLLEHGAPLAKIRRKYVNTHIHSPDYFREESNLEKDEDFREDTSRYPERNSKEVDDAIESFFHSMGQSVKRLPLALQAEIKLKVCQIVTEAEIQYHGVTPTSCNCNICISVSQSPTAKTSAHAPSSGVLHQTRVSANFADSMQPISIASASTASSVFSQST